MASRLSPVQGLFSVLKPLIWQFCSNAPPGGTGVEKSIGREVVQENSGKLEERDGEEQCDPSVAQLISEALMPKK